MSSSIRAFFAVDIDDKELKRKIVEVQKELALPETRIKFVEPNNLHLTLKFLGDIDESIVPELQKAAEKITFEPFTLELQGVGCLPSFSYINAIYIGVIQGFEPLKTLATKLEQICAPFNVKKERRAFKAHLTIGRLKRTNNKALLVEKIRAMEHHVFGTTTITKFKLKKSVLTQQGPRYSTLFERTAESL
ncbi:MAG: RNA 2',3'-cyclic phosphodiesterase [Candidatus Heimdallarchaeota archaeon]